VKSYGARVVYIFILLDFQKSTYGFTYRTEVKRNITSRLNAQIAITYLLLDPNISVVMAYGFVNNENWYS
jgi:2-iminoacetate synthase ThiH